MRASSLADYESSWRRHLGPRIGATPLCDLDGTTIARLVVALTTGGVSLARLAKVLVPLRACLRWHHRMGSFGRDPTPWFDICAPRPAERRILTIEQVESLVAALPAFYRPMISFAAYTGVRLGELRAITWADVDLEARTVRIDKTYYRTRLQSSTKTGLDRTVPVPRHVAASLREWRTRCPSAPDGPLFPQTCGRPLDGDEFRRTVWRDALRAAGLPATVRIHDLRHTSASLYLQHGATVREVMDIHGWTQMQTAMRYLHAGDTLIAAADRLSEARDDLGGP
jgi:integrase